MIVYFPELVAQHQQELRDEAQERRTGRATKNVRRNPNAGQVLVPAGNGLFRWSDDRNRAA
jgi:hypothetical protein